MLRSRAKASVHQIHAADAELAPDARVVSIMPLLAQKAEDSKPYSKFYHTDLIGRFGKWRGIPVQDAKLGTPNYNRRRTVVESPIVLAGLAGAIALTSFIYNRVDSNDEPHPNSQLLEHDVVSGSEVNGDRIAAVDITAGEATYYEERGNVLCRFSGIEIHEATVSSSRSDVVTHTDGRGFELSYGSDCYESATLYVDYLNPQGFNYSLHDPTTFDSSMPNELRFPVEVRADIVG